MSVISELVWTETERLIYLNESYKELCLWNYEAFSFNIILFDIF